MTFWLGLEQLVSLGAVRADVAGAESPWPQGTPALPSAALAHPLQGASLQKGGNSQMSNTLSVSMIHKGQGKNTDTI